MKGVVVLKKSTVEWIERVAAQNKCSPEDVLSYLRALSSGKRVLHHLVLA